MENLTALSDTELIAETIAAQLRKDWEEYAELKKEFFQRIFPNNPGLPEQAQKVARWAGLSTF
jgi:hypothetical protein